jgi:hypothetical protein
MLSLVNDLLQNIDQNEFYRFFFYEKSNMFELFLARVASVIKKKKLDLNVIKGLISCIRKKLRVPCFAGSHLFAAIIELVR